MQLRTDKSGLMAVFKAWQVPLIEQLLEGQPMNSREAWQFLEENDVKTGKKEYGTVSRASVINFLNDLVDQGLLDYTVESGRGGFHRIYEMILTREAFAYKVMGAFVEKLREVFPTESRAYLRGPEN